MPHFEVFDNRRPLEHFLLFRLYPNHSANCMFKELIAKSDYRAALIVKNYYAVICVLVLT